MLPTSGQVTGAISTVALSFMVHEPREIIDQFRDKSCAKKVRREKKLKKIRSIEVRGADNRKKAYRTC